MESNTTSGTVTPSTTDCTSIQANASCQLPVTISSTTHPGSFVIAASGTASSNSMIKNAWVKLKVLVGMKSDFTVPVQVNIGLVNVPTNSYQLYVLPPSQTLNTSSESRVVMFSVLVESSTPIFDTLNLGSSDITATAIGSHTGNYSVNDVVTFSAVLPPNQSATESFTATTNSCTVNCSNSAYIFC